MVSINAIDGKMNSVKLYANQNAKKTIDATDPNL